jgi:hypothetical protein
MVKTRSGLERLAQPTRRWRKASEEGKSEDYQHRRKTNAKGCWYTLIPQEKRSQVRHG